MMMIARMKEGGEGWRKHKDDDGNDGDDDDDDRNMTIPRRE